MIVLMKYLSREHVENLISALHFHIDKMIFFGNREDLAVMQQDTGRFLRDVCGVAETCFYELPLSAPSRNAARPDTRSASQPDPSGQPELLPALLQIIRETAVSECSAGNRVFADLTGCDTLVSLSFGMLAQELSLPLHLYRVESDQLILLNKPLSGVLPEIAEKITAHLDLDKWIRMRGGVINYRMHKEIKGIDNQETESLINRIWQLFTRYEEGWPAMSGLLQKAPADSTLTIRLEAGLIRDSLKKQRIFTEDALRAFLKDGEELRLFCNLRIRKGTLTFTCASKTVLNCLTEAGSILELHIYQLLRREAPNSKVGVHLDWDGVIHRRSGEDVLNEIDVISLKGFVPTFISCKLGRPGKNALYELSAVTRRFGGKYAKMILVAAKGMSQTDLRRAADMQITVTDRDLKPFRIENPDSL